MTLLTQDFFLTGAKEEFENLLGLHYDAGVICSNGFGTVIEGKEAKNKLEEAMIKSYEKDELFFKRHLKTGESAMKSLVLTSSVIKKSSLNVPDIKLLKLVLSYKKAFCKFSPYLFSVFPIESILTNKLKAEVKMNEAHFRILTSVRRDSDFYLEQKELLTLIIQKKSGRNVDVALERHAKNFGYMGLTNDFTSRPWDANHFRAFFKDFKDPEADLNKLLMSRKRELDAYKKFTRGLSKNTIQAAEILQDYMWFRNERISALKIAQYNIKSLLTEIANRLNVPFSDLIWYKVMEIEQLLKMGVKVNVANRKLYIRAELVDGKLSYIEKEKKQKIRLNKTSLIKGTVASMGQAEGIVKVLHSYRDINKVEEGDILVTSMTTPDFVMAMRRAAAIVTDEGGVLCHAAIVSREFGIPCITGTKIATQILKDGDKVFVDAEKGTVQLL